jgi:hypothetical protein
MNYFKAIDNYIRLDSNGQIKIATWRRQILPSWLYFDLADVDAIFTIVAAPNPTRPVGFKQSYSGTGGLDMEQGTPFEVKNLLFFLD